MAYTIIDNYVSASKYTLKCPYSMTPIGITIHNTANDASALNEVRYMANNLSSTSYHVAVDDVNVVLAIPFNRNAWHAGDGSGNGNRKTIGIEICYSKSGGVKFDNAEKNAAKYIATLLKEYGWTIKNIYRHKDWSGKNCPHRTMANGWERFLNMVQGELDKLNGVSSTHSTSSSTTTFFLIKVDKVNKGDVLNIRKEPHANSAITGKLSYNDPNSYTIVETKNGWGLLKSKIGWINLAYTKTVSGSAPKTNTVTATPKPVVTPTIQKSLDDWAKEVVSGKHGVGHANRENSLKKAGCPYSYNEIKTKVNALCGAKTTVAANPAKSLNAWAKEVINGKHGNGHTNRAASLKKAGCPYSYAQVKARVNALLKQ